MKARRIGIASIAVSLLTLAGMATGTASAQSERVSIPAGSYHSLFPEVDGEENRVESFLLDAMPVDNASYQEFVMERPEWRKDEVSPLLASKGYLKHWKGNRPAEGEEKQPVRNISWYAASSYCEWVGGRLPDLDEWEYAAERLDIQSRESWDRFGSDVLGWLTSVDPDRMPDIGSRGVVTLDGVQDMHKLILEWVNDFRPPLADGLSFDCGTAGRLQGEGSEYRYASVVRTITRMSFEPETTTGTLGFRCAYNSKKVEGGNPK